MALLTVIRFEIIAVGPILASCVWGQHLETPGAGLMREVERFIGNHGPSRRRGSGNGSYGRVDGERAELGGSQGDRLNGGLILGVRGRWDRRDGGGRRGWRQGWACGSGGLGRGRGRRTRRNQWRKDSHGQQHGPASIHQFVRPLRIAASGVVTGAETRVARCLWHWPILAG
jgi:hypothetical protein